MSTKPREHMMAVLPDAFDDDEGHVGRDRLERFQAGALTVEEPVPLGVIDRMSSLHPPAETLDGSGELEEAAELDGCGYWRRYWNVILPLSRPALASLAVLFFLANWNAFLWPLTITTNQDLVVTQLGIAGLQGQYASAYSFILAAAIVAAIPTVVVFLAGQRRLVDAMKTTGLK